MMHDRNVPRYELLQAADVSPAPMISDESAGLQLGRRALFRFAVVVVAGATGLELGSPELAHADASPITAPPEPSAPAGSELNDAEIAELHARQALEAAQTKEAQQQTALRQAQLKQVQNQIEDSEGLRGFGETMGSFTASIGVAGAIFAAIKTIPQLFRQRARTQQLQEEKARTEQEAVHLQEDDSYTKVIDGIKAALDKLADMQRLGEVVNYDNLHLAYSELQNFAGNPRFAERIFGVTATLLRSRARALRNMTEEQREDRVNTDRELYHLLTRVAPQLPRQDAEGKPIKPNAAGIALTGMRNITESLEHLRLDGAFIEGPTIVITGSLAGSTFRLARLMGATFGEPGGVCDIRGADFSRANLEGAVFAHVLADGDTQFGAGQEGNPCATFGNVTWQGLTPAEGRAKIEAAKAIIETWRQAHPEPAEDQR